MDSAPVPAGGQTVPTTSNMTEDTTGQQQHDSQERSRSHSSAPELHVVPQDDPKAVVTSEMEAPAESSSKQLLPLDTDTTKQSRPQHPPQIHLEIPTPSASQSQVTTLVESVIPAIPEQEQEQEQEQQDYMTASSSSPAPLTQSASTNDGSSSSNSTTQAETTKKTRSEGSTQAQQLHLEIPASPTAQQQTPSHTPVGTPLPIPQTPQTYITFLLISGHRRTMSFEPGMALSRVKELAWNGWPSDWPSEERPPAPSYLRILYLGRMLQDDETLLNLKLPTYIPPTSAPPTGEEHRPPATIMHISVRPFGSNELDGEGSGSVKKKMRRRGTRDGAATDDPDSQNAHAGCCGCVIC